MSIGTAITKLSLDGLVRNARDVLVDLLIKIIEGTVTPQTRAKLQTKLKSVVMAQISDSGSCACNAGRSVDKGKPFPIATTICRMT